MSRIKTLYAAVVLAYTSMTATTLADPPYRVLRVDAESTAESPDGSNWTEAFSKLQDALQHIRDNPNGIVGSWDEIWVANGVYRPTDCSPYDSETNPNPICGHRCDGSPGSGRLVSFCMRNKLRIYGGFAGWENSLNEREPDPDPFTVDPDVDSVLSGDLSGNDDRKPDATCESGPIEDCPSGEPCCETDADCAILCDCLTPENWARNTWDANLSKCRDAYGLLVTRRDDNSEAVVSGPGGLNQTALLDGLSITAGYSKTDTPDSNGREYGGGGFLLAGGSPRIWNCTINGNRAENGGGAIYSWANAEPFEGEFVNCVISENFSHHGGGSGGEEAFSPKFINCYLLNNASYQYGGALTFETKQGATPEITNCVIARNTAGPIWVSGSQGGVKGEGGAIWVWGPSQGPSTQLTITNSVIANNRALKYGWEPSQGGGVYLVGNAIADINDSIIWGNEAGDGKQLYVSYNSEANIRFSNVDRVEPDPNEKVQVSGDGCQNDDCFLDGNLAEGNDPLFMDADGSLDATPTNDYALTPLSPCKDSGSETLLHADLSDLDMDGDVGEPIPLDLALQDRIEGCDVDMGAYELQLCSNSELTGWGDNTPGQLDIPLGSFKAVAAMYRGGVAIRTDGTLVEWGWRHYGGEPIELPSTGTYTTVAGGFAHGLAIRSDGTLAGWGYNVDEQATIPEELQGGEFVAVAAGGSHSLAIRTDGTLVGWGSGQAATIPPALQGDVFVAVAAGWGHNLAIRSNGTLAGWGDNTYGQATIPEDLQGDEFVAVAAGWYHSLAIRTDGSLVSWGRDDYGQTTTVPDGTFSAISGGELHSLAICNAVPPPPIATGEAVEPNRYLRFRAPSQPGAAEWDEIIRIRVVDLDGFSVPDPIVLYLGQPFAAPEEDSSQPGLTFAAAPLDCAASAHAWASENVISAFGAEIMPTSIYEVQRSYATCPDWADCDYCWSQPLTITTGKWGDVAPLFDGDDPNAPQPDFNDISALVQKFLAAPGAPIKAFAQLRPNRPFPDRPIDFKDIAYAVSAFLGISYKDSYGGQYVGPCTCPSLVTCNTKPCEFDSNCSSSCDDDFCSDGVTACTENKDCSGFCISGFCTDACGRCTP